MPSIVFPFFSKYTARLSLPNIVRRGVHAGARFVVHAFGAPKILSSNVHFPASLVPQYFSLTPVLGTLTKNKEAECQPRQPAKGVCQEPAAESSDSSSISVKKFQPDSTWAHACFLSTLNCRLQTFCYDRHRSVTGPCTGCATGSPVRRDSKRFAFRAKYHFAGRSASSISIRCGWYCNPSAC